MKKLDARGIAHFVIPVAIIAVLAIGGIGYMVATNGNSSKAATAAAPATQAPYGGKLNVQVMYKGKPVKNAKVITKATTIYGKNGSINSYIVPDASAPDIRPDGCADKGKKGVHPTFKNFSCKPGHYDITLRNVNIKVKDKTKHLKNWLYGSTKAEVKNGQTTTVIINAELGFTTVPS